MPPFFIPKSAFGKYILITLECWVGNWGLVVVIIKPKNFKVRHTAQLSVERVQRSKIFEGRHKTVQFAKKKPVETVSQFFSRLQPTVAALQSAVMFPIYGPIS